MKVSILELPHEPGQEVDPRDYLKTHTIIEFKELNLSRITGYSDIERLNIGVSTSSLGLRQVLESANMLPDVKR